MTHEKRTRVALLYGGRSGEHEVSLMSAASVLRAIDKKKYDVTPIGVGKDGRWFISDSQALLEHNDTALTPSLPTSKEVSLSPDLFKQIDVVLPIMHGPLYEDGCLQGFLDLCEVAYVGSGAQASSLAMDKVVSKQLARLSGVNIVDFDVLRQNMTLAEKESVIKKVVQDFSFPLFVKPARMGSSVGIEKVNNDKQLREALDNAFRYDEKVLVEKMLCGREIELAVLETDSTLSVSLAGEIQMRDKTEFYSYNAKYFDKEAAQLIWPASLDDAVLKCLQDTACQVFRLLECDGLARVDFFVEDTTNAVYFNELNTLPGFTEISMYPKLMAKSGVPYTDLISKLIGRAQNRFKERKKLVRDTQ